MSRNGRVVAFAASFRENGDRYDPAATPTVFVWDRKTGTLGQVTATGPSDQPSAKNGTLLLAVGTAKEREPRGRTVVAFRSTGNLAGRNADGSPEIFAWDSQGNALTQITDAAAGASSDPDVGAVFTPEKDAAGLYTGNVLVRFRVAFRSTSDLTGDNPLGLPQVFLFDSGMPEVERIVQVSHSTTGSAGPPAIDGNGQRVAFVHDGGLLPGEGGPGVYVWDLPGGLRRATEEPGAGAGAAEPAFDGTGRWLAWSGDGTSPGGRRVLLADLRTGRLRDFAPAGGSHRAPALGKGRRSLVCLSSDPGDGGDAVAERPVVPDPRGGPGLRETGLPGGSYGAPRLQAGGRRLLYFTSTGDLAGTNAAGRNLLYVAELLR